MRPRLLLCAAAASWGSITCGDALTPGRSPRRLSAPTQAKKNFVDEILDAVDSMLGVSPLGELDLNNVDDPAALQAAAERRSKAAPPEDALEPASVSYFFAFMGFVPLFLSFLAIASGAVHPFGM